MAKAAITKTPNSVADLRRDPKNARRHGGRNLGLIRSSLEEFGAGRSILIDEENQIIAGNGTVEAAAAAGITKVQVVDAEGDTIIAVRRHGLTDEQKTRMALFDNQAAATAEWDPDVLRQLQEEGTTLGDVFTEEELAALLPTDAEATVEQLAVARPSDIVHLFMSIPLAKWPKFQAAVEAMQDAARFHIMVMRPRDTK